MARRIRVRCPCCGMIANLENFEHEDEYPQEAFVETYGGKRKLTPEDRKARRGLKLGQGSAPGKIEYTPTPFTLRIRQLIKQRLKIAGGGQ